MNIAIVTDSTADLPSDLADQYQIHIVPNLVIIDGQSLVDVQISRVRSFYRRLPEMKTPPTTALPRRALISSFIKTCSSKARDHVISIHTSSQLSGIFNAAHTAAQEF